MRFLSSNAWPVDIQVIDAVDYGLTDEQADAFRREFPEFSDLARTLNGNSAMVDFEAVGVDPEYMNWVADWIEANTDVTWWEGEPVIFEEGDEDDWE